MREQMHRMMARIKQAQWQAEDGMTTAEYAIGTIAAASFAGVLIAVVKSGGIRNALAELVKQALSL